MTDERRQSSHIRALAGQQQTGPVKKCTKIKPKPKKNYLYVCAGHCALLRYTMYHSQQNGFDNFPSYLLNNHNCWRGEGCKYVELPCDCSNHSVTCDKVY